MPIPTLDLGPDLKLCPACLGAPGEAHACGAPGRALTLDELFEAAAFLEGFADASHAQDIPQARRTLVGVLGLAD